jgi:hypothetical protein
MDLGSLPAPQPPTITLNGQPIATPPGPWTPNGFQVVVLDSTQDLTAPASVISNHYANVWQGQNGEWWSTYTTMFDNVTTQILGSGDPEEQVVILASFGLDVAMVPNPVAIEQFLLRGAGPQLQQWATQPLPSEGGWYIQYPANYILIGDSEFEYNEGFEKFEFATQTNEPIQTSFSATLENVAPPPLGPPT